MLVTALPVLVFLLCRKYRFTRVRLNSFTGYRNTSGLASVFRMIMDVLGFNLYVFVKSGFEIFSNKWASSLKGGLFYDQGLFIN